MPDEPFDRLKSSWTDCLKQQVEIGKAAGLKWAEDSASYHQLERIANLFEYDNGEGIDETSLTFALAGNPEELKRLGFCGIEGKFTGDWCMGFATAAAEVWRAFNARVGQGMKAAE
jgi:hypothetical protein